MSNEAMNFASNSELEKYLKERKEAQTEEEIKKIMDRIYGCIAEYSKLIHAFKYTIPPTINEDGSKTLHPDTMVQLALIYSETEAAYLPVYTNVEESKNRGNVDTYPELTQFPFEGYYDIVFGENSILQGIVINPYTDNLVLSKSKIENLMNIKMKYLSEKYLVMDQDLKIPKNTSLQAEEMNKFLNFIRGLKLIDALWIFEKKYYKENDNTEYNAVLLVVQDNIKRRRKRNVI